MILGFFCSFSSSSSARSWRADSACPRPGPVSGSRCWSSALALYRRWRPFNEEALAASELGQAARGLLAACRFCSCPRASAWCSILGSCASRDSRWPQRSSSRPSLTLVATVGVFLLVKRLTGTKARGMTPFRLWVYLQTTPLFWLTATLAAFLVADALAKAAHRHPMVNHVLIAIALLGGLLKLTGTDYQTYFNGAQFVHFLLGPATVALGVPIYTNFALVRRNFWPMAAALLVGAVVAIASALLVAKALGAPRAVLVSLAPKSITAGVAMAVSETLGGAPPLTAVLVIATGILGAIVVTPLMNALGVTRFRGAGIRRRARFARHRNGSRLLGRSGRRRLRRARHGAQRCRDPRDHSGAAAVASTIIEGALTPRARRP